MKTIKALILSFLSIFIGFTTQAQRAKHGNYTVSTMNDLVNTYTNLTASATAGSTSITVASNAMSGAHFTGNLAPGDLIMIYQAYGADVNIDTGPIDNGWGPYTVSWGHTWSGDWPLFAYEWGELWDYGNAGKFEQVEVAGVNGGTIINLQCGLKNNYDFDKKVQVVRIPRYDNLTVNSASSIVPTPWNGTVGGIVAIEVETALTVNTGGLISASGFGFRGGQLDASGITGNPADPYQLRYLGTTDPFSGSEKGESIFGYHAELDLKSSRYGIGAPANGGGGGGFQNAGGGGGSNVSNSSVSYTGYGVPDPVYNAAWALDFSGAPFTMPTNQAGAFGTTTIAGSVTPGGGRGGYALAQNDLDELSVGPMNSSWGGDARKINGGRGGHPLTYDATRLFFGGGGGAGDQDNGQGGAGGTGGGIVYISSYGTITGAGTIAANGGAGQNSNPNLNNVGSTNPNRRKGNDGAGGAGGGGAIFIENATAIPATISLTAIGGNGGNQNIRLYHIQNISTTSDEAGGPGGSGAGGSIAFSSGTPSQNVNAGSNGVVNSERGTAGSGYTPTPNPMMQNFPPNGATNGSVGMSGLAAPYYDLTIRDTTICSGSVDLTVTVLGSTSGTIGWYTQQFGGTTFDTGLTTTVSPAVTTTYYVGVCPGTFRIPVTVTVNSADDASFATGDFCETSVNTISGIATPGGTFSISAQTGSATINPTTGVLAGYSAGDQITIQYTTPAGPCQNSSTQVVDVTAADDASFTSGDFCASTVNTISGVATPSGTFSIAAQTGSGSATINPTTGVLSGFSAGDQITIRYTTPAGPCQNSTTQVVNVNAADDASFTSGDFCVSTVNTISGVATPSGTFSISAQTGTATINSSTGVLAGFAAGDQITIQYTTPAGACQNSSTQVVNVNPTPVISTVATPISGCNMNDGQITVSDGGNASGTGVISWTGPVSNNSGATTLPYSITSLPAGTYDVTFTDNSTGCVSSVSQETFTNPGTPSINSISSFVDCDSIQLPAITGSNLTGNQAYYDGPNGTGNQYAVGDWITSSMTLHAYDISGMCSDEESFNITIHTIPVAAFTANPASGCSTPHTVFFTDQSTLPDVWSWNFGDASTSTAQNPIHSYTSFGSFTVTLTVTDTILGCVDQATTTINVSVAPVLNAVSNLADCDSVQLVAITGTNLSGNEAYYSGTNGTGTMYNSGDWINTSGTYYAYDTSNPCSNERSFSVTINASPTVSGPTSVCRDASIALSGTGTPNGTTPWSSSNTSIATVDNLGNVSGVLAGTSTITYLDANGCSETYDITVNALPVITGTPTVCVGGATALSGSGTPDGTTPWSSANNTIASVDNLGNVSGGAVGSTSITYMNDLGCAIDQLVTVDPLDDASFTSGDFCVSGVNTISGVVTPSGTFSISAQTGSGSATIDPTTGVLSGFAAGDQITIQYTTPAGGCQNSSTQVVNVFGLPAINVSSNGPVCLGGTFNLNETGGDAVSWSWSTSGGATITTNTDQSPTVTGAADGDVFDVVITDANTCTNNGSVTVSVTQSPVLDPIADVVNCGPYTLPAIQGTNLTGSEAYYDNSIASGGVPITGPINSSQTVWVYDGIATCEDEISFNVTIDPLPTVVSFTGGNNYCVGDIVTDVIVEVTGTADWTLDYTLDGAPQSVNSTTSTISLGNTPGVYVLTSLADLNCSATVSGTQTIVVTATPAQPVASGDETYCAGDLMSDMTVSGAGGTYTWYSDNTLTTIYGTGSSIAPLAQTMTYSVTESLNGCESTADDVMITVENCEVIYPSAFTPDGDGTNDTWEILGLDEKYPDNVVRVYNRWGNLIFEHKSSITNPYDSNRWDGTYKGSPLPVGSFYYIIDLDGTSNQETGTVSIILN